MPRHCSSFCSRSGLARLLVGLTLALGLRAHAAVTPVGCGESALGLALALSAPGDTLVYTQDCTLSLTRTLVFTNSITIDSSNHAVSITAAGPIRLLSVASGVTLRLNQINLSGGRITNSDGAALYVNAGATAVLTNCTLAGNTAVGAPGLDGFPGDDSTGNGTDGTSATSGGSANGGAIFNLGTLTLRNCRFLTNSAAGGAGGTGGDGGSGGGTLSFGGNGGNGGAGGAATGGAIYNAGSLTLTNCTFTGNGANAASGGPGGAGGAGHVAGRHGTGGAGASGFGGAIYSLQAISFSSCTFAGNTARGGNSAAAGTASSGDGVNGATGGNGQGGAVYTSGTGGATNCTFFGNQAAGGAGGNGGLATATLGFGGNGGNGGKASGGGLYDLGTISAINCTFATNGGAGGTNGLGGPGHVIGSAGKVGASEGGNAGMASGTFNLKNTILAGASPGTNAFGTFQDLGNNLSSDNTPTLGASSKKNTNPLLSALADNGGPQTMSLASNSPARNAGNNTGAPLIDERGVPRDSQVDIGAYEISIPYILSNPTNLVVTNGDTAVFRVIAEGLPPLRYQWRWNGSNVVAQTNASLTITNVQSTNAGSYAVVISNPVGSVTSAVATLTITNKPIFTLQPSNTLAGANTDVIFAALAAGSSVTYQWKFGNSSIPGATSNVLVLPSVQSSNAGVYSVIAINPVGFTVSSNATLTVVSLPIVTNSISSNNALTLTVPTRTGFTYVAEFKTNLTDTQWLAFGTNKPVTNGTASFSSGFTNGPSRFFRIRIQ